MRYMHQDHKISMSAAVLLKYLSNVETSRDVMMPTYCLVNRAIGLMDDYSIIHVPVLAIGNNLAILTLLTGGYVTPNRAIGPMDDYYIIHRAWGVTGGASLIDGPMYRYWQWKILHWSATRQHRIIMYHTSYAGKSLLRNLNMISPYVQFYWFIDIRLSMVMISGRRGQVRTMADPQ